MTTRRTLHLPALLGTLAAAVLVTCAVALLAVSEKKAEAAFPGKNGKIAYNSGGVIYTINPDGSAKTKVANTRVSGYPIDYSPDGKKLVYYKANDLHGKIYTINLGGGGKSKVTEGSNPSWGSPP
jgi:Tol biopolymer transport system component